ncbi:DUF5348 domain-containing protein [Clostridium sp. JS66]|uniref:DUF5348 domain-containing protein n=1 Tax=Clostridium sp. JS66 TaxID=3064705 RepID=UPI00298E3542|nr:DUF5348 domain-containing protein [Clostridium sp. JS66]WPC42920.1 DUF5348 domain-containing protein [Clostridium sp. JS66]
MNKNYTKALDIAENTLCRINSIYDNASTANFEDIRGCKATEKLIEDLEGFIRDIKHYSKPIQEGYLQLKSNGRYSLENIELTCGYPVEIYNTESHAWNDGRIEHSDKYNGYYFYNYDENHIALNNNIRARVRI